MANALLYECFSGIAGDMHLGALLDIGLPVEHLRTELDKLGLNQEFELNTQEGKKMGIAGTQVKVVLETVHEHARGIREIKQILDQSQLPTNTKKRAIGMFDLLAQAEAKVHDIPVEKVHFHEVGAVDAIVDITGAAIGIEYFGPSQIYCTNVELGSGTVKCAHGLMPVPAPATALLLETCPTTRGHVDGEATTPTGATILAHSVNRWQEPGSFKATQTGYGIGHKDFVRPNVLRLTLGEVTDAIQTDTNICIECNIDDMSPEGFEPIMDRLFELGAKDVYFTPITMKKSRPATKLAVLVAEENKADAIKCILQETTAIGLRSWSVEKSMYPRTIKTLDTPLGRIRVKVTALPDGSERLKPEFDDVRAIANAEGIPYQDAHREITAALNRNQVT